MPAPKVSIEHPAKLGMELQSKQGVHDAVQLKAEAEAAGSLLAPYHPATQMVRKIGLRIAEHAADPGGGGRTDHMKACPTFVAVTSPFLAHFLFRLIPVKGLDATC